MSLFVDVNRIKKNIKLIKETTKKEIMAVLKDNAYGISSNKMIEILYKCNVKWIVYNTYKEYLKDKTLIIKRHLNVLILESITQKMINDNYKNLYLSINSKDDFLNNETYITKPLNIHLQIDTGMNRMGIRNIDEAKEIISLIAKNKNINLDGIYTHFSSSDNEYEYYYRQLHKFKKCLKLYPFKNIHSAATSSLNKKIIGNMVRIGLALYGYGNKTLNLLPSISYVSRIINSFKVLPNESIGYDQKFVTKEEGYISVVPIGYYDISGVSHLIINKQKIPIVGKTCMNHLFLFSKNENKKSSQLLVLSKNDIIGRVKYNWYQILISLKNTPKNFIERGSYDISTIFKRTKKTHQEYQLRRRSYQNLSIRTIRS